MAGAVIKGDFAELKKMIGDMRGLQGRQFRSVIMQTLAEETLEMVQRGFLKSQSPYGNPWRPSRTSARERRAGGARMKGQGQILRESGRLLNSIRQKSSSQSFTVGTNVKYAAIHQFGGTITQGNRTNVHGNEGRFISKTRRPGGTGTGIRWGGQKTELGRKGRKGRAIRSMRVSFTFAHSFRMPGRPFLPTEGLPPTWRRRYVDAFNDARKALLGR